ncbi:MAG: sulfite exporter TauE/SafE family protein [Oscillospiraceae bacterium]|nr:sulfite exporter TauE/SafE family protein [Oscillospiraceae bacterium]
MMNAVVGVVTGVIASMGLGGGFVLLIWLTLFMDMPQRAAQGINLLFFLPIAVISVIMHLRAGLIDKKLVLSLVPGGIIGAVLGTLGSQLVGNELLRKLYALFLLAFGLRELFRKAPDGEKKSQNKEAPD